MLLQMQSLALEVPELQIAESGNVTPGKMSLYNCPVLVFFFFFFTKHLQIVSARDRTRI